MLTVILMKRQSSSLLLLGLLLCNAGQAQQFLSDFGLLSSPGKLVSGFDEGSGNSAHGSASASSDIIGAPSDGPLQWNDAGLRAEMPKLSDDHPPLALGSMETPSSHSQYTGEAHHGDWPDENPHSGDALHFPEVHHSGSRFHCSVIPEPTTYAIFLGLAAFGLTVWRRAALKSSQS